MADDTTHGAADTGAADTGADGGEGGGEGQATAPESVLEVLGQRADETALLAGFEPEQYFFAYDTLMDQALVGRYIKNLLPAKIVKLQNHRLIWPWYYPPFESAVPSLERTNRDEDCVWGILYDARRRDFKPLEEYLKVPNRYHRRQIHTMDRGERRIVAFTYVLTPRDAAAYKPARTYRDKLVELAQTRNLPAEWLTHLRELEVAEAGD